MNKINTHNLLVEFGRHKGERWTRVPLSYLRWLVNKASDEIAEIAMSELERRGTEVPKKLELTSHSIDRASQITKAWKNRGVYSWLQIIAEEALNKCDPGQEKIIYKGYKFVFDYGRYYPLLVTITSHNKE